MRGRFERLAGRPLGLAVVLAIGYWLFESALHAYLWHNGPFFRTLLGEHDPNELWMRFIITALLLGFGAAMQRAIGRERMLRQKAERFNHMLNFLSHVNQDVQRRREKQALFEAACHAAVEAGGFRFAWIGLLQDGGFSLRAWAAVSAGRPEQLQDGIEAMQARGKLLHCAGAREVLTSGCSRICSVLERSGCDAPWRDDFAAAGCCFVAALPIRIEERAIGVLEVYTAEADRFDADDMAILDEVADDISMALTEIEHEARQKDMAEKLRTSREQTKLLLESTAEAIYGLDLEGRCTFANPSCLRLLGYGAMEELLGRNMHELIHHTRPDGTPYPMQECRIYEVFRKGHGTHVDDEVFWRKDGTCFATEYWSYPIHKDGRVAGAVVTFLDVSLRKQAEDALKH